VFQVFFEGVPVLVLVVLVVLVPKKPE